MKEIDKQITSVFKSIELVLGISLFCFALWKSYTISEFMLYSKSADGVVVDFVESTDGDGDAAYYPVIEFEASDQLIYQFEASILVYEDDGEGQYYSVRYLITDPSNAKVNGFWRIWGYTIALFVIALVIILHYLFAKKSMFEER
ncbi:DUF3592 domain-containing protein [Pleionea sp. CnH1-48]|uniref:DUF3592 domain-containing protein n=1 Tax=Pleionea sp. CnH1-48 TaxID=2954494 RepID=UPI002096A08F|nr:DUF3592 domain-containing protein [Pleionea sp. CnH1-48]MCO7224132.1 DUF3592 domain-containing protein [Pleionea sp. CnH1-48]